MSNSCELTRAGLLSRTHTLAEFVGNGGWVSYFFFLVVVSFLVFFFCGGGGGDGGGFVSCVSTIHLIRFAFIKTG